VIGASRLQRSGGNTFEWAISSGGSYFLTDVTNSAERLRIDNAGNVGIGTSSPATKLVLAGNNDALVETNTLRFWDTDTATEANQQIGKIEFFSSDASTPGASVKAYIGAFATDTTPDAYLAFATATTIGSVTERMRIDNVGNVGIGTSSPTYKLNVVSNGAGATLDLLTLSADAAATGGNAAVLNFKAASDLMTIQSASSDALAFGTANTERMRIDSAGNVGIGTSSPAARLDVTASSTPLSVNRTDGNAALLELKTSGTIRGYVGADSTGSTVFYSSGAAERARIDTSGNLLVGTTSSTSPNPGFSVYVQGAGNTQAIIGHSTSSGSGQGYVVFAYDGGTIGSISQSGTTAVSYNTSSDYRLKHDIQPMTGALATVAQLKPVTYKWNADDSDGEGFIAHELQEVAPYAVSGEKDGEQMQGVDYGKITPLLTAALQEAIAEIQSLKARVAELEAK
jgi:hypothetical protein